MSTQRSPASSQPSTSQWKYDVFLSFRGPDTRRGFTRNLYTALEHEGIKTFMDDPKLRKGEVIAPALLTAIEESRIAIIVLSKNYASSWWCLDELVRILECMKASETVLPVFFDVDPCEVRRQTGSFGEAFIKLEERFSDDKEKLLTWRTALAEVANLSGWTSNDERYETELIGKIVGDIWKKLPPTSFGYAENLVAMDRILEPVHSFLGIGEDDVRFIGIWGMGGIGKTTMVRAVHDKISSKFEFSFLITNVRDSAEKVGVLNLQKQLLFGMIQSEQVNQIFDLQNGATAIRKWLRCKKVLLILDDVNDADHLKYLAGNQEWFGFGSRVLITTRNEHLLIEHGVERRLKSEKLNGEDSLELFSWKAFKKSQPQEDFLGLSNHVVSYAQGLPLALEVLGSSLYGRDLSAWNSALSQLGRVCNLHIMDVLKISYNDLDKDGKKIFLDIACFFNGQKKNRLIDVLTSCDLSAKFGIDVLMERSLLTETDGRLWMHNLLRDMGHEIVHQESPNELGRRSRLWLFEDVRHVLTKNTGTEAIEGIYVDSTESEAALDVTPKSFSMMHKLRYLKIANVNLSKGLEYLPDSLRILDWTRYPLTSLPAHFNLQKLFKLTLRHSRIKHLLIGNEPLWNLRTINLSHSLNIVNTPNFKDMPYLEVLLLEGCIRLYEVDQRIEVLEKLTVLNLKDCKNLVHFPSSVRGLKSLKVLNLSGCSKLKKLPNDMGHLESLEELHVNGTGIRELPSSIGMLERLPLLQIQDCKDLVCLPASIGGLKSLKIINLSGCSKLERLPEELCDIKYLEEVDLGGTPIQELPSSIGMLEGLVSMSMRDCKHVVCLPSTVGGLKSLKSLDLSGCSRLDKLPDELGEVAGLEKLDVNDSGIREVPSCIGHLKNLKELSFAGCKERSSKSWNMMFNPFQLLQKTSHHIPAGLSLSCLSGLHSLTALDLSDCNLTEEAIPSDFGCLASLTRLDLRNNQFVRLPESIRKLSRLGMLHLEGCRKLRILPQFGSNVRVNARDCISLESLANQIGQCNSVVGGLFHNCLKMVENDSSKSIALRSLACYLESKSFFKVFDFVCPGNEIPEWYNHQNVGSSVTVELHPGWLSNMFMGFACCVTFRVLKPLPPLVTWFITFTLTANGQSINHSILGFGGESAQPVLDHIRFYYFSRDSARNSRDRCSRRLQDIYYQLEFSFKIRSWDENFDKEKVQIKKSGVRLIYEDDVKELQTLLKQSSTKRSLQHYDDDDDEASSGSTSQAHPKRIKQLHLDDASSGRCKSLFSYTN